MKLEKMLKREAIEAFKKRKRVLIREVHRLREIVDILKNVENPVLYEALLEVATVRAVKTVQNSGYTFKKFRLFLKSNLLKPFKKRISRVIVDLERHENELTETIKKVKDYRDHLVVHLDPRFAFNEKDTEKASLREIEKILTYLEANVKELFEKEY
ncbi:hypothetical protein [Kosmotoga pacifica]|uniref:HEPN domain-containing protein n=1 Tax=Kosmotoga pacifica TaxID=1330330 RepID=A0A0G2ZCH3_9BACT|nr:hypothetical protein [Kosmotoga pacifica]AKI97249.1 hypothetical protein IX53_04825 [Kosmotoga pacifica]